MAEEEKEAVVQEHKVFNLAEPGEEPDLRDAWGRSAEEDEEVVFAEDKYQGQTIPALKQELADREARGREFDKKSIKTKRDLVAALTEDDRAQAEEARQAAQGDNDPDPDE